MQAITVRDRDAGVGGLSLTDVPYPHAAENDVIVRVHAAGFTPGELDWPATWTDRAGRDRTPSVPGHELSGVVVDLGYGTTGLTVGQRVFGLTDWPRDGSLAEYTAVEGRNLAPLPADVDHIVAAALPISGLTPKTGAPFSSSSKPTAPASRPSPRGSGTDGSSRSSAQYGPSPMRLRRSPSSGVPPARPSSRSPKADSRRGPGRCSWCRHR